MLHKKLYVVTRQDLSKSQQAVQAGHALAVFLLKEKSTYWNGTLVYLKVSDELELKHLTKSLECANIHHVSFKEPDIDNELTAIASLGNNKFFKRLKLL